LVDTFGLTDVLPHCVLAHVDVQAEVERRDPGSTRLWFQSLAGTDSANRTFDLSTDKMLRHAAARTGRFGLYLETGQGADFTNGHGHGFDMVLHEARKYGFARALARRVAEVRPDGDGPWLHVNDVAGFIGPEVFEEKDQLVRCCLEDLVMGKLHGLTIGLDVCSTLHMKVSLDDLDECLDRVVPARPAYLMALPTRNDPMLSYLTTSFQDHVRLRTEHGLRVDDRMAAFFRRLGVVDADDRPTERFGDPLHVWVRYRREKGDDRPETELRAEGERAIAAVEARGVPIARGHGAKPWDLAPALDRRIRALYHDAKESLHATLDDEWIAAIDGAVPLATETTDRDDYVRRPPAGERLSAASTRTVERLRDARPTPPAVQVVASDGLNARAIQDEGHAVPFLAALRAALAEGGVPVADETLVLRGGRVRAGYRIGELLFGRATDELRRTIVHVIGERPGSGHHAFSVYVTTAPTYVWAKPGKIDHDATKVVSGVADTALAPEDAARTVAGMVGEGDR
ncbi:MAG: ethanolamine ammonia-lyase subunit EutB, partial [Planctomycetota bacterium JB042]